MRIFSAIHAPQTDEDDSGLMILAAAAAGFPALWVMDSHPSLAKALAILGAVVAIYFALRPKRRPILVSPDVPGVAIERASRGDRSRWWASVELPSKLPGVARREFVCHLPDADAQRLLKSSREERHAWALNLRHLCS